MPGRMIMIPQMFLEPRVTTSFSIIKDFKSQTTHGKNFMCLVCKFTDSIVEFYLHIFLVGFLYIICLFSQIKKWIIDVRINLIGMMDIDHCTAPGNHRIHWYIFMDKACLKMVFSIEKFKRGN